MKEQTETKAALAAMIRAAEAARIRADRFGTRLARWKGGVVVFVDPETNTAEQAVESNPGHADTLHADRSAPTHEDRQR